MSSVSQTPGARPDPGQPLAGVLGRRVSIMRAAVVVILVAVVAPNAGPILRLAAQARPHAPNLALLAGLPAMIQIHLAAALAALGLGAVLMTLRKGRTFHRTAGWLWVGLVALVAGSSLFITTLRPGHLSLLHLITGWVLIALPLGVVWAKRHEVGRHRRMMMGLFYGGFAINLLVAFLPGRTLWQTFFGA